MEPCSKEMSAGVQCGKLVEGRTCQGRAWRLTPPGAAPSVSTKTQVGSLWEQAVWPNLFLFVVVRLLSCVQFFVTPWTVARQAALSVTVSQWGTNSCPLSQWCRPTISSSVALSPPALNLSQHEGLFQRVDSSHQVAKVLELQLQHQSFQWIFRVDLGSTGLISLQSKGHSRVFSNITGHEGPSQEHSESSRCSLDVSSRSFSTPACCFYPRPADMMDFGLLFIL